MNVMYSCWALVDASSQFTLYRTTCLCKYILIPGLYESSGSTTSFQNLVIAKTLWFVVSFLTEVDWYHVVSFSCLVCCLMKLGIFKNKSFSTIWVSSFMKYLLNSFPAFLLRYLTFFLIHRSFNIFWMNLSYDIYIANIIYILYGLHFHYLSGVFYFYPFFKYST